MMKTLLTGTALCLLSFSASAADLPLRGKAPAPVFASASNWGGFYAGVVGTAAFGTVVTDDQWCYASCSSNTTSGFGGGAGLTLGFNVQNGGLVYGLEADFSGLLLRPERSWYDSDRTYGIKQEHKLNWYSTVRGRIGVSLGSSLVYATGGLALVNSKNTHAYIEPDTADPDEGFYGKNATTPGFAAGFGLEHSFGNNWSLKAEYMYIGTRSTKPVTYTYQDYDYTTADNARFTPSIQSVRVGLNYRFGGR